MYVGTTSIQYIVPTCTRADYNDGISVPGVPLKSAAGTSTAAVIVVTLHAIAAATFGK